MANFEDLNVAARMIEVVRRVVKAEMRKAHPPARYGEVVSVDTAARVAQVQYPGEADSVPVPCGSVLPQAGSTVRVSGPLGSRYIEQVLTDPNIVSKTGDTMTGIYDLHMAFAGLRLRPLDVATSRPYLEIYGGSNANRALYLGWPNLINDDVNLRADKGNLLITAGAEGKSVRVNGGIPFHTSGDGLIANSTVVSLGSPSSITSTSTNSVTGTSHSHSLTSIGNVTTGNLSVGSSMILGAAYTNNGAAQVRLGTTDTAYALSSNGTSSTANTQLHLRFSRAGTLVGSITHLNSTTAYNTSSDARLKTEIDPVESPSDLLARLRPKWFAWENGQVDYGLYAQEANEVWPNAVTEGGEDVSDRPWQMDYGKLVGLLVGSVQELTARVKELEARLEASGG